MLRRIIYIVIVLTFLPYFTYGQSSSMSPEDIEISELKSQIKDLENKIKILEQNKEIRNTEAPTATANTRVAKRREVEEKPLKVGLALSGGGAKGLAHVGVLRELEKANVQIDYITGTSVGAIVGAMYSIGYTPDEIEDYLKSVNWNNLLNEYRNFREIPLERKFNSFDYMITLRYDKKFNFSIPKSLGDSEITYFQLKKIFKDVIDIDDFDQLPIPLRVVATDLNTGRGTVFRRGDLARVIAASSAIPAIFDPVEIDNRLYVDGLISQNFPVQEAFDMGADVVIGSNVGNVLKDNEDYSIVGVINQLMAIPSASSTEEQKRLATILISPNMDEFSATDGNNNDELVRLGEQGARDKLSLLNKLEKRKEARRSLVRTLENSIYIENIVLSDETQMRKNEILLSMLDTIKNQHITYEELEKIFLRIYGLDFVDSIYYHVDGTTLYVDSDINPSNTFGIGFNYSTGYGSILNIGTEFSNIGKVGNSTFLNVKLGDHLGFEARNFFYYGTSNKIGIFANVIVDESPFYLYSKNKKIGEFERQMAKVEFGAASQINNRLFLIYGIDSGFSELREKIRTNIPEVSAAEYSRNINNAFLKITYDTLNSIKRPTDGYKIDVHYIWGGSFGRSGSNYYGPLYTARVFRPIDKKTTFKYGISGGALSGDNIYLDQYIKIGGMKDDINNREFAFAGLHTHQKLVKQFIIGKVEIEREIMKNLYLNLAWNFGTFEEVGSQAGNYSRSNMWKEPIQGFGIGAHYETMFGPVEFSLSKDGKDGSVITQVNVGYRF